MFCFTVLNKENFYNCINFYFHLRKLNLNNEFTFVCTNRNIYNIFKSQKFNTNLLFLDGVEVFIPRNIMNKYESFLFIDSKNILAKNPIPAFKHALLHSEVVFYEKNDNYDFWGANCNEKLLEYYPNKMKDYSLYLEKNEGSFYTLPSFELTATKNIVDYELNTNSQAFPAQATVA